MIRLALICFLSFIIGSKACYFNEEELNELKQRYFDGERRMEEATRDQNNNAVIVLGNERNAKSALINYLIGNELEVYIPNTYESPRIRVANNNTKGPEIVYGRLSKSEIPTKWRSTRPELQNLDIWYTAGFEETEDKKQELSNSFYLHHLSRKVKNLKFILIINFEDIEDEMYYPFLELLQKLEKYFNGTFKNVSTSISVIVSNIPHQDVNGNQDIIRLMNDHIQTLLDSDFSISKDIKDFFQYLINNKQRVTFFWQPQSAGKLTSADVDGNIISALNNSKSISWSSHQDMGFPISKTIELCLKSSSLDYNLIFEIVNVARSSQRWFKDKSNDLARINDTNTLNAELTNLRKFYNIISSAMNNSHTLTKIQSLKMIPDIFDDANNEKTNMANLILFFDNLFKLELDRDVNLVLNHLIESVPSKISELISLYELKLNSEKARENN